MWISRSVGLSSSLGKQIVRWLSTNDVAFEKGLEHNFIHCHQPQLWHKDLLMNIASGSQDAKLIEDFVTAEEEELLERETYQPLRRLRYEEEHWDDAIRKYREIERSNWSPNCQQVIDRLRKAAFPHDRELISTVHVLDLAPDGYIKPHIDSVRYCGHVIAGLSLLTDSIMRLVHKDAKDIIFDIYLKRRSLYILTGTARYDFTHEVLANADSYFKGRHITRATRRISVMCRDVPHPKPN